MAFRREYQVKFGGLDHREGAADGTIYDMSNMTTDELPVLSTRQKKATVFTASPQVAPLGFATYDCLVWIDGSGHLYIDNLQQALTISDYEHQQTIEYISRKLLIHPSCEMYDPANHVATTMAASVTAGRTNLLDNWYFVGGGQFPINQRGANSYTGIGYGIDRWQVYHYSGSGYPSSVTTTLGTDGITISNNGVGRGFFGQTLERLPVGTYTVSLLYEYVSGEYPVAHLSVYSTYASQTSYYADKWLKNEESFASVTFSIQSDAQLVNVGVNVGEAANGTRALKIKAIKLELGSTQTLAHQENDVWVLNDTPDYEEELLRCTSSTDDPSDTYANQDVDVSDAGGANIIVIGDGKIYGQSATANTIYWPGGEFGTYFKSGDGITISGCSRTANNKTAIVREVVSTENWSELRFYENSFDLPAGRTNYVEHGQITFQRSVPDMDFIMVNDNRVWGCKGDNIYASKLGDPQNWNVYDGLETDSWAVDTGTPGAFTGCVSYLGYPIFFKEDKIFRVYGEMPSRFQVAAYSFLGVKNGCAKTIASVGSTIFYLSTAGVVAYSGGAPRVISEPLGNIMLLEGVGGSDNRRYYLSARDSTNRWRLYVYDTATGLWHIESDVHYYGMGLLGGNFYGITDTGNVEAIRHDYDIPYNLLNATTESDFDWHVEFNDFFDNSPDKKWTGKVQLRMLLDNTAKARLYFQADSAGAWTATEKVIYPNGRLPINLQGKTYYDNSTVLPASRECINLWKLDRLSWSNPKGKLTITENDLVMQSMTPGETDCTCVLSQSIKSYRVRELEGKTVTFSALVKGGVQIVIKTLYRTLKTYTSYDVRWRVETFTLALPDDLDDTLVVYIGNLDLRTANYKAVKLEIGESQTLARQIDGEWVILEKPDVAKQYEYARATYGETPEHPDNNYLENWYFVGGGSQQVDLFSVSLPLAPRRNDHYRYMLTGTGGAKLYSLAREYSPASER